MYIAPEIAGLSKTFSKGEIRPLWGWNEGVGAGGVALGSLP